MKNYKDLDIYKLSYELAVKVHGLSLKLPNFELFEEGSQIRRAAESITANIVEGYGRKKYKAEFIKFLNYAHASCDETILHLNFLKDTTKALESETASLIADYDELGRKINKFIDYVEKNWQ